MTVNLRIKVSKKWWGYCWYHKDGSYDVTIYLGTMLRGVLRTKTLDDYEKMIWFIVAFWMIYSHEVIGHGIGHKFKTKGYSSRKKGHFEWFVDTLMSEVLKTWKESGTIMENYEPFREVADFIIRKSVYARGKNPWNRS